MLGGVLQISFFAIQVCGVLQTIWLLHSQGSAPWMPWNALESPWTLPWFIALQLSTLRQEKGPPVVSLSKTDPGLQVDEWALRRAVFHASLFVHECS